MFRQPRRVGPCLRSLARIGRYAAVPVKYRGERLCRGRWHRSGVRVLTLEVLHRRTSPLASGTVSGTVHLIIELFAYVFAI